MQYTVAAAALPNVEDLRNITEPPPADVARFSEIPPAPPAVADLLDKAPKTSKWDTFDFLRTYVLSNVTATGTYEGPGFARLAVAVSSSADPQILESLIEPAKRVRYVSNTLRNVADVEISLAQKG